MVNSLRYGDADTITDNQKVLNKIGLLADDLNRQISLSEHMSEVLASGLEVLQSLYNNQLQILNNRMSLTMTWLTILGTAVLVPNTLATIFGFALNVDLQHPGLDPGGHHHRHRELHPAGLLVGEEEGQPAEKGGRVHELRPEQGADRMDANEVRESIPIGDICQVSGTRSTRAFP